MLSYENLYKSVVDVDKGIMLLVDSKIHQVYDLSSPRRRQKSSATIHNGLSRFLRTDGIIWKDGEDA